MNDLEVAGMALSAIGELLSFFCAPLKRKDRLGHRDAQLILLCILVICFVVSFFGLSEWWLIGCACPLCWLPLRWVRLRAKVKLLSQGKERDLAMVRVVEYLTSRNLFEWEIRHFLLPRLIVYFEIGALVRLRKEIEKLSSYKDHTRIIDLNSLLLFMEHRSEEALSLLKDWVSKPDHRRERDYPYRINNLYHAAMVLEDHVAIDYAFALIEEYVDTAEDEKKIPVPLIDALMFRYDTRGDVAGVERVKEMITRCMPYSSFDKYLELGDILLFYNKRHHFRQPILHYLDEVIEKSGQMITDEERHLVFQLKMAPLFIEYNYGWKEITVQCFQNADFYLHYSYKTAVQYMNFIVRTLSDVYGRYGLTLPLEQQNHLVKQIYGQIGPYMEELRRNLFEFDDMWLYRKRDAYRLLIDYAHLQLLIEKSADTFVEQIIESYKMIIRLCRVNGDVSEHIRSIVSYLDEYIVREKEMYEDRKHGVEDADILRSHQLLEAERSNIQDLFEELKALLKRFDYDRALAYDTLYAAYFCLYFHDKEQAKFHLLKFEGHRIDVSHYIVPVQDMYRRLKTVLENGVEEGAKAGAYISVYGEPVRTKVPQYF